MDDEPALRDVIRTWLEADGYHVQTADDGLRALEEFHKGSWDLVITDRIMPKLTGDALAAAIKQIDPTIPIILVTGSPTKKADSEEGALFDLIVRKPFRYQSLREGIDSLNLQERRG